MRAAPLAVDRPRPLPPPARPPARHARAAGGARRSLRLDAARLHGDLPAAGADDAGRRLLRRARRRRLQRLPRRAAGAVGGRHRVLARRIRRVACRRRAADRPHARRRGASVPPLPRARVRCLAAPRARPRARSAFGEGRAPRPPRAGKGPRRRDRLRTGRRGSGPAARLPGDRLDRGSAADRCRGCDQRHRRLRRRGDSGAARHRGARGVPVPGAGAGDLVVHAVRGDRHRAADRRVGVGRIRRAPRRAAPHPPAPARRAAGRVERRAAGTPERRGRCRRRGRAGPAADRRDARGRLPRALRCPDRRPGGRDGPGAPRTAPLPVRRSARRRRDADDARRALRGRRPVRPGGGAARVRAASRRRRRTRDRRPEREIAARERAIAARTRRSRASSANARSCNAGSSGWSRCSPPRGRGSTRWSRRRAGG